MVALFLDLYISYVNVFRVSISINCFHTLNLSKNCGACVTASLGQSINGIIETSKAKCDLKNFE